MEIKLTAGEKTLYGLIYKFWYAEASEQEIKEDVAALEDSEMPEGFDDREELYATVITVLDPENFVGEELAKMNYYILQIEG